MAKDKFTPGPWRSYEHDKGRVSGPVKVEIKDAVLAEVVWRGEGKHEERIANAQLMAAATTLLEACRMAFKESCARSETSRKWTGADQVVHETLKAAILAATGKEV